MKPLKTVLVGYGRIGADYVNDHIMKRHIKYATHAQVLDEHPCFEWTGIIDENPEIVKKAKKNIWGINNIVSHPNELHDLDSIDVVVLATPPEVRTEIIQYFPNLKAVIVEKPIGVDCKRAENFLTLCNKKNIAVAVNITRRYDDKLCALQSNIHEIIGNPQCGFGVYGNGLMNNGTHLIDLIRMLFGEIKFVYARNEENSKMQKDFEFNPCFSLELNSGTYFNIQSINYSKFREMSLEIWGSKAHLIFLHETLKYKLTNIINHPYATDERALNIENPEYYSLNLGYAQYNLYENLYSHLSYGAPLLCDGNEALRTLSIIDHIKQSYKFGKYIYL